MTQMEAIAVHNDYYNYMLTFTAWAEKLEVACAEIISRRGSDHAFLSRGMDAYRVVLVRHPLVPRSLFSARQGHTRKSEN